MMINKQLAVIFFLLITSCYEINKNTTEIADLNTSCLKSNTWSTIKATYSIKEINTQKFKETAEAIKKLPLKTEILFLKNPDELIAISKDHYTIRYIYNPEISVSVLNGLSSELSNADRKRVRDRILNLLIDYQCSDGVKESRKMIDSEL